MTTRFCKTLVFLSRVLVFCLFAIPWLASEVQAADKDAMQFNIPVLQDARRHIGLLEYPAYLAVALDNAGMGLSRSGKITIWDDGKALQYKTATLRFVENRGPVFRYAVSVDWGLGMVQTSFKLPVEVDISSLEKGQVNVRVFPPFAKLFPQELTDRIQLKIQTLADISLQKKMLDYFDGLEKKRTPGSKIESVANLILIQAYNLQAANAGDYVPREPGDAEPLSDQLLLLITLTIWLVIVPLVALGRYLWRKYRKRPAESP
jgi:hypothetical protein